VLNSRYKRFCTCSNDFSQTLPCNSHGPTYFSPQLNTERRYLLLCLKKTTAWTRFSKNIIVDFQRGMDLYTTVFNHSSELKRHLHLQSVHPPVCIFKEKFAQAVFPQQRRHFMSSIAMAMSRRCMKTVYARAKHICRVSQKFVVITQPLTELRDHQHSQPIITDSEPHFSLTPGPQPRGG